MIYYPVEMMVGKMIVTGKMTISPDKAEDKFEIDFSSPKSGIHGRNVSGFYFEGPDFALFIGKKERDNSPFIFKIGSFSVEKENDLYATGTLILGAGDENAQTFPVIVHNRIVGLNGVRPINRTISAIALADINDGPVRWMLDSWRK